VPVGCVRSRAPRRIDRLGSPLRGPDGHPLGRVLTIDDVTEQVRREEDLQHREHLAAAPGPRQRMVQLLLEQVAVRQARQAVVEHELANLLLGALALGDVLRRSQHADRVARAVVLDLTLQVDDADAAVRTDHAELDAERPAPP